MTLNETIPFTRRYPDLPRKKKERDSKIALKIITAWDVNNDEKMVLLLFQKYKNLLSDPRYWELMKSVWIICGGIEQSDLFRQWMLSKRPFRHYFMTPEEATFLNAIVFPCNVFRACNENDNGLSYTISEDYAKKYQIDFGKKMIITRTIERNDVFAYINRNGEEEIIIL